MAHLVLMLYILSPQTLYSDCDKAAGETESGAQPTLTGCSSVHEDPSSLPAFQ